MDFRLFAVIVLMTAGSAAAEPLAVNGTAKQGMPMTSGTMAPPPDYEVVTAEEFSSAVAADTNAALIRFIARHPDIPLADKARDLLANRHAPDMMTKSTDSDAGVIAAFDAARLNGSATELRKFATRYAGHPLEAEAVRIADQIAR